MEFIQHINEGFDLVNVNGRNLITITDLHQNGVDISLDNNPQYYNVEMMIYGKIETFPCISIFKRKPYKTVNNKELDGNPVLYALKGEKRYEFYTEQSRIFLMKRFKEILQKVFAKSDMDNCTVIMPQKTYIPHITTGIAMPSSNALNSIIIEAIQKVNPKITFIKNLLYKIKKDDLLDVLSEPSSCFYDYWLHKGYDNNDIADKLFALEALFNNIPGEYYRKHLIKDPDMRNAIQITMNIQPHEIPYYFNHINGKDILLVDDTITYGQTLAEAISILRDNYSPKSITILTLFSKKMK